MRTRRTFCSTGPARKRERYGETTVPSTLGNELDPLAQGCYATVAKFEHGLSPRHRALLASWCQAVDEAQSGEDADRAYRIGSGLMEHLEQIGLLKRLLSVAAS